MRPLLHNLIDEHIALTAAQKKLVRQETMRRSAAEPGANLLRMIPGMLPLLMIPFLKSIRARYGLLGDIVFEMLVVIVGLALVYWLFRRAFVRHARGAIRDLGFADVCPRCGYDLSASTTVAAVTRCPECGIACRPFREAQPP